MAENKRVTGVIAPISGAKKLLIISRGPPCSWLLRIMSQWANDAYPAKWANLAGNFVHLPTAWRLIPGLGYVVSNGLPIYNLA